MRKRRIVLILSPYYNIQGNGLADYSSHFANALSEEGVAVKVATLDAYKGEDCYFSFSQWNILVAFKLLRRLTKDDEHKHILIEFVPHMYNPKGGLAPSLALFTLFLRLITDINISIMFHELHYPFSWRPKDLVMFFCHHFMFILCMASSHQNFFSTHAFLKIGEKYAFHERNFWLPVGSNIERAASTKREEFSISYFGGFHQSRRFDLICKTLSKLSFPFSFHIIGNAPKGEIQDERFHYHGHMSNGDAARLIASTHCMISYFSDGVSTRRGSVLAALNQGVPCITTVDWGTDPLLMNFKGLFLCSTSEEEYEKEALRHLNELYKEKYRFDHICQEYDEIFQWKSIIKQFLSYN